MAGGGSERVRARRPVPRPARGSGRALARTARRDIAGRARWTSWASRGTAATQRVVVLVYRDGKLVDKREFHWEGLDAAAGAEFLAAFLGQFYEANPAVPERVEVPFEPLEADAVRGLPPGAPERAGPARRRRSGGSERGSWSSRATTRGEAFRLRFRHPRREAERVGEAVAASLGLPNPVLAPRVLRHLAPPGRGSGRVARRLGEREAQEGGVPVVQRPLRQGSGRPGRDRGGGRAALSPA